MKIRTDPRSVATDAVAMAVSTMEHVLHVTRPEREHLTAALNSYATDLSLDTDKVVSDILTLTQSVLTTPASSRSLSRVIVTLAAGNIIADPDDALTRYLGTVTDLPMSEGSTWTRLSDTLDAEFMARFTPEWWTLANVMLDAIYLDIRENDADATPITLLMVGALPPVMDALYEFASPEFGEFPGELLVTMFADQVATRIAEQTTAPDYLAAWAQRHAPRTDDN